MDHDLTLDPTPPSNNQDDPMDDQPFTPTTTEPELLVLALPERGCIVAPHTNGATRSFWNLALEEVTPEDAQVVGKLRTRLDLTIMCAIGELWVEWHRGDASGRSKPAGAWTMQQFAEHFEVSERTVQNAGALYTCFRDKHHKVWAWDGVKSTDAYKEASNFVAPVTSATTTRARKPKTVPTAPAEPAQTVTAPTPRPTAVATPEGLQDAESADEVVHQVLAAINKLGELQGLVWGLHDDELSCVRACFTSMTCQMARELEIIPDMFHSFSELYLRKTLPAVDSKTWNELERQRRAESEEYS